MPDMNVTQFAKDLGLPVALLIEQLQTAGVKRKLAEDTVLTEKDKTQLLDYLRQAHGGQTRALLQHAGQHLPVPAGVAHGGRSRSPAPWL